MIAELNNAVERKTTLSLEASAQCMEKRPEVRLLSYMEPIERKVVRSPIVRIAAKPMKRIKPVETLENCSRN